MRGYHVVDLAPPCDGLSDYSNGQAFGPIERYSFRAELLNDLEHVIGTELVEAAYLLQHEAQSKLAAAYSLSKLAPTRRFLVIDAMSCTKGIPANIAAPSVVARRACAAYALAKW